MNAPRNTLRDDQARATAISALDRSLLVEAGAGSGKTAVMAGRVAMLLAEGAAPRAIAAVTFTELAAGELLLRVRAFVDALLSGQVPAELAVALPDGLNARQRSNLQRAAATIDQVTCSTIHGFCQRLILPYPVEANIDPGAGVMDRDHADQVFDALVDQWLWSMLDGDADSLLAQLVAVDAASSLTLVRAVLGQLRSQRALTALAAQPLDPLLETFALDCAALQEFVSTQAVKEAETAGRAGCFAHMASELARIAALSEQARLAQLLDYAAPPGLCNKSGAFRAFQAKGKWRDAATAAGLKAVAGNPLFERAHELVTACQESWIRLKQEVAADVLVQLLAEMRPVLRDFQDYKRNAALLDFDDLIHSARALLRDHDDVRRALGQRYTQVLVDEFQDTDPLQSEIFWRLCGDPVAGAAADDWVAFAIRPGALFLVGDPKQAIYRFRGADIAAYTAARDVFAGRGDVLSIATNFRSCAPILDFVNQRFAPCLGAEGQPGFTPLDAFHAAGPGQVCVAALEVAAANEEGTASAGQQRAAEAEAVADMCAKLIGNRMLGERPGAQGQPCRAGDIALLAPTGSDLWRYEEALERRGIAVATQAGKGFYRRQEVQDLIALCRVLADSRDTIALGALLRGPLVGLTEEELLDIVLELPRAADHPERPGRLSVRTEVTHVSHAPAREVLARLQALRRQMNSTSPHMLLAQAVDEFRVRPILLQRHGGRAERALANVDKFVAMSQAWAVRGLAAFAAAMTQAWADASRAPEGQPDAQEDAVTLYTMHSAKGLEWPIVVPINTMTTTRAMGADSIFWERSANRLCGAVFGTTLPGYEDDHAAEAEEIGRERQRLWYVAATRARELLVLPRLDVAPAGTAWISLVDLGLDELPALALDGEGAPAAARSPAINQQTRELFEGEAAIIAAAAHPLRWRAPSRDEGETALAMQEETAELRIAAADEPAGGEVASTVQGGRERGLVMHKLFEEVLNGETADDADALQDRAAGLIAQVGPAAGLSAREIAACVANTLGLPAIAELRPGLVAEYCVYAAQDGQGGEEVVTAGIADAIGFSDSGQPEVIIDWKSDVNPTAATIAHYRAQVGNYLAMTGAKRGLIVLVTSGRVIEA
jgi:exodeoxyribonuclease-5